MRTTAAGTAGTVGSPPQKAPRHGRGAGPGIGGVVPASSPIQEASPRGMSEGRTARSLRERARCEHPACDGAQRNNPASVQPAQASTGPEIRLRTKEVIRSPGRNSGATGRAGDLWTADLRRRRERRRIVAGPTALTIVGAGRILGRRTTQCRGPVPIPVPGLDPQRDEVGEKAPGVVVELDHGSAILTERFDAAWPTDGRAWQVGQVALTAEYDIKMDA